MKHLFNKLSAFIVMLMCMSATVQAEIVHHEVCQPTQSSRGFTRECWENTETGEFFFDQERTQAFNSSDYATYIKYPTLPTNPVTNSLLFYPGDENWDMYAILNSGDISVKSVKYVIRGDKASNARIIWTMESSESKLYEHAKYDIVITVNDDRIYALEEEIISNGNYIVNIPDVKPNDKILFLVDNYGTDKYNAQLNVRLEYTFECSHDYNAESNVCSKCGTLKGYEEAIHHSVCAPTLSTRGFTRECWEVIETGKIYSNAYCGQELTDADLAKTVVYSKLPASPISGTSEFLQSEHENDWSVDLNWAAVTTFNNAYSGWSSTPRYAEFTVKGDDITNARLVWNRNEKAIVNGKYTVSIYVNGSQIFSRNQNGGEEFEGVFVQPLPGLKQGDVVKFEVTQNAAASTSVAKPIFKACLEYTSVCDHEYPAGSAICSKCGYVKEHEHNYVNHECTLCGAVEKGDIIGYVGTNADRKDIKWVLDENTHILTFTGTGAMEAFNLEHNAWRNENKTTVTKVIIGEGITNIGDGAYPDGYFIEMSGLTEVVLPSTLKTIGSSGFQDCVNLTSITLPEGLETIKENGIRNCKKITSITLPSTLTSIGSTAFADCSGLRDMYIAGSEPITTSNDAFSYINRGNITLHVNGDLYDWAKATAPWSGFNIPRPYNIVYTDAEGESHEMKLNTDAADNSFTLTDGVKSLTIYEDIPMQTLTYTRNFSAANTWQALYVPFGMAYSDWAGKFDVAAITNFHEYTDENGETEKIELEVRYVKNGKLRANTPYLIRAKAAGEQTIVLNGVTLQTTGSKSIDCRSTEREYTFTGTYDAIDGLQTKDYIFVSGGRLCKAGNDTDVLKPMRWYLTITERGSMTINPSPALAKPITIHVIGEDDTTGIEDITVVSSSLNAKASGIYSISGVKLAKPQKGINIVNGKKVNVR